MKRKAIGLNIHHLYYLEMSIIFEDLTKKNVCPHIFKTIHNLAIIGAPNSIQTNLFAFFPQIEYIILNIDNLEKFLHQGIDWMTYLNKGLRVNTNDLRGLKRMLSHIKIININEIDDRHLTNMYTYPDEDLCVFRSFPHKQLVMPFLPNLDELECTCTIVWLEQNYRIYSLKMSVDFFQKFSVSKCSTKNFTLFYLRAVISRRNLKNAQPQKMVLVLVVVLRCWKYFSYSNGSSW